MIRVQAVLEYLKYEHQCEHITFNVWTCQENLTSRWFKAWTFASSETMTSWLPHIWDMGGLQQNYSQRKEITSMRYPKILSLVETWMLADFAHIQRTFELTFGCNDVIRRKILNTITLEKIKIPQINKCRLKLYHAKEKPYKNLK